MWQVHTQTGLERFSSPQVMESKEKNISNISTDQPAKVVISIPAAQKYNSRGWGKVRGISPNSTF